MPEHALEDVKALVHASEQNPDCIDYYVENSIDVVSDKLNLSFDEAERYILREILALTDEKFVETRDEQLPPADVYSVSTCDGISRPEYNQWFVKLNILPPTRRLPEHLKIWSFHHPEFRLVRT